MFSFFQLVTEELPVIRVVDVGAAEYGNDPYARLSEQGLCEVIGFEPHAENCARRNASARPGHHYLPYAVGDGRLRRFYECEDPLTSSLYPPNAPLLEKFAKMNLRVVAERDVQTRRLDDLEEIQDIDFLKLDAQGAELDVIQGASRLLKRTLVVDTEIEFIPLYAGQPLFADVDLALRKSDLWLHQLNTICPRTFSAWQPKNKNLWPVGQAAYSSSVVYVRSFMSFDRVPPEKLLKLAVVLHEVYQSWDLTALALTHYDALTGNHLREAYLDKFA